MFLKSRISGIEKRVIALPYRKELVENLKFMVIEVVKQVEDTLKVLDSGNRKLLEKINERDDYIDTLKSVIENKCFLYIKNRRDELNEQELNTIKALNIVANNIENIADYSVNVVGQTAHLKSIDFMRRFDYKSYFKEILNAIDKIISALLERDINLALEICRSEMELDKLCANSFSQILEGLRKNEEPESLVTALLIFKYLERMGDALLNIGEACVSSVVGERLKIHQYHAIEGTLDSTSIDFDEEHFTFKTIAETLSGCKTGRVQGSRKDSGAQGVIFKEGRTPKIISERENICLWNSIEPGIAPRVFGYREDGDSASLLLEYINGSTIQELLLYANSGVVNDAIDILLDKLCSIWKKTKKNNEVCARYLKQLSSRIEDVFMVHQGFRYSKKEICGQEIISVDNLLADADRIERSLHAPFAVLTHGDLNNDNIIYNHSGKEIHFVDLYRSGYSDFTQDASVFLLSNFRLPVFDKQHRENLNKANLKALYAFREFASYAGDEGFEARMSLGLARSFITSTRFELNEEFAGSMFQRGIYIIEKLINHDDLSYGDFRLPEDVLIY